MRHFSDKDFLSGLMFVLIGAFGAFMASSFEFGSTARPGPGFFPVVLSSTLMIVGAVVAFRGLLSPVVHHAKIVWRPLLLITLGVLIFGICIERFGLVPSVFAATFTASFAKPGFGHIPRIVAPAVLAGTSAVIFIGLLNLPIPLWSF